MYAPASRSSSVTSAPGANSARRLLGRQVVASHETYAPSGSPARPQAKARAGGPQATLLVFLDGRCVGSFDVLCQELRATA
jgi:hypothetical protein